MEPALDPHRERFGRLVNQVARHWRRAVNARLQPLGLTDATWSPLLFLARVGPTRQVDLADHMGLDRSSVVRLIDTLADQGLVTRQDDKTDRRAKRIALTRAATPVVRAARDAALQVRTEALADLTGDEIEAAARVLDRILARLTAAEEEPAE